MYLSISIYLCISVAGGDSRLPCPLNPHKPSLKPKTPQILQTEVDDLREELDDTIESKNFDLQSAGKAAAQYCEVPRL